MAFTDDIFRIARTNDLFRKEIATSKQSQVVVMCLRPGEEIGMETHDGDQHLVVVEGSGEATLDGKVSPIGPNHLVFVPAGTEHNVVNTGPAHLRLFTVYAPPEHPAGTVHATKEEADAAEGH